MFALVIWILGWPLAHDAGRIAEKYVNGSVVATTPSYAAFFFVVWIGVAILICNYREKK
jgi:hypothetical protein